MNDFARDLGTMITLGLVAYFAVAVPLAWKRDAMRRQIGRWEQARRALGEACGYAGGAGMDRGAGVSRPRLLDLFCGAGGGLAVRRHRLFETNVLLVGRGRPQPTETGGRRVR